MRKARRLLRRLVRQRSGVALTELALALPFLLTAGLWGVELANFAVTNMRVSQLATHLADNASRIGDTSTLENRKIYESDINDLLFGANLQAGQSLDFFDHGRAIISSLEVDPDDPDLQYIHWQRCMGVKEWDSSYGLEGDRLPEGMGPAGEEVFAFAGEAVVFVEVAYEYQPLVSARFIGDTTIDAIASFTVRSDRDLTRIYQRDPALPDPVAGCGVFQNTFGGGSDSTST